MIYSSYGGGAESVCPACGVQFERGGAEGSVPVVSCEACGAGHHEMCVREAGAGEAFAGGWGLEVPWVCVACGRAHNK